MNEHQFEPTQQPQSQPLNTSYPFPQPLHFLETNAPLTQQSKGVQHLKQLQALHYILLVVFFLLVITLVYIIKKHFTKYLSFYLIRKDYLRLNAVQNKSDREQSQDQTLPKRLSLKQKLMELRSNLMQNTLTYHPVFHFVLAKLARHHTNTLVKLPKAITIAFFIISLMVLMTFSLLLSKINSSICDEQRIYSSFSYICSQRQSEQNNGKQFGIAMLAVVLTLIVVINGTYLMSRDYFKFMRKLKNQQKTNMQDSNRNQMKSPSSVDNHPTLQNMLGDDSEFTRRSLKPNLTNKQQPNKNLFQINEEEEPFSPQKEHHSEIIVDELSHSKNVLGENKNILNASKMDQSLLMVPPRTADKDYQINDPPQFSSYTKDNEIADENNLKGYTEKNLQNAYSQSNLTTKCMKSQLANYNARPHSQVNPMRHGNHSQRNLPSMCGMSDSTTVLEVHHHHLHPNSSNKNLEGIIEEIDCEKGFNTQDQDVRKSYNHLENGNTPGQVQVSQVSKEEYKEEETSRILMMNKQRCKSDQNVTKKNNYVDQEQKHSFSRILKMSLIMLGVLCCLIMCALYIAYSFFNMTEEGLINVLTIFGFALFIDYCIMRLIFILSLSIYTTSISLKTLKTQSIWKTNLVVEEEDEQLLLIGEIYQDYELPMLQHQNTFYNTSNHQSLSVFNSRTRLNQDNIDDSSRNSLNSKDLESQQRFSGGGLNNNNGQQQQRVIKLGNKRRGGYNGELVLIESTFFYHQDQLMIGKQVLKDESQQMGDEEKNVKSSKEFKKKAKAVGEEVTVTGSMAFNANEIKVRKAHTERLHINEDDSHYDIEEIPMYSSRHREQNQNQEHYIDQDLPNKDSILPPIFTHQHQFETPKALNTSQRINLPMIPNPLNISQQIITFNESLRDSQQLQEQQRAMLRELVMGNSDSSKKLKVGGGGQDQYQSIQRYLNNGEDKENMNSANKSLKFGGSILRASINSSIRHQKYLDDKNNILSPTNELVFNENDEMIKFTPQYNSLKSSKLRKSMADPDIFTDINLANNVNQELYQSKKRSNKNSTIAKIKSQLSSQVKSKHGVQSLLSHRKSCNSPSSIKENLEHKLNTQNLASIKRQSEIKRSIQPNISPFNDHKFHEDQENTFIEPPTMNMPSPAREFNILQSIDFNQNPQVQLQDPPKVRDSSTSQNLKKFLQPQVAKSKSREKQISKGKFFGESKLQSTNGMQASNETLDKQSENIFETQQDSQKAQVKGNKPNRPQIRPKAQKKQHKRKESQVTFQTDNTRNVSNTMNMLLKNSYDEQDDDIIDTSNRINDSRDDGTCRSKMFEDSDSSTFRLISFGNGLGSRQRSKQQLLKDYQSVQTDHNIQSEIVSQGGGPIDFYSNDTVKRQVNDEETKKTYEYKTQEFKKSKKQSVAEIIVEENIITHNSSPEKRPNVNIIEIQDSSASFSDDNSIPHIEPQELDNQDEFNMMHIIENHTQDINVRPNTNDSSSFDYQNAGIASRLINRRSLTNNFRTSHHQRKQTTNTVDSDTLFGKDKPNTNHYDTQSINSHLRQQEELRKKREDNELLMLRIEDQRRKLKHFLKLARQLKSTKDEKKIKEFLKYLKEHQKPLPYAKINELKQLEIMSSPYNQSLIDMIKDEYDQFKKGDRKIQEGGQSKKSSKSQQRQEAKKGALINKLSGIYGSQVGPSTNSTTRKPPSRQSSASIDYRSKQAFQQTKSKLKESRSKMSKESHNSNDNPQMFKKRKNQRNVMNIIEGNQSFTNTDDNGNQIKVMNLGNTSNFGNTTSEDEETEKRVNQLHEFNNRKLQMNSPMKQQRENNKQDYNSSVEFNDLQQYMGQ